MKKKASFNNRIEKIETDLWRLDAEMINTNLLFPSDEIVKAVHSAGLALYNYRHSLDEKKAVA